MGNLPGLLLLVVTHPLSHEVRVKLGLFLFLRLQVKITDLVLNHLHLTVP